MNKLERLEQEIGKLENLIGFQKNVVERKTKEVKECMECDPRELVAFLPGKVDALNKEIEKLDQLEMNLRQLQYILGE